MSDELHTDLEAPAATEIKGGWNASDGTPVDEGDGYRTMLTDADGTDAEGDELETRVQRY